MTTVVALGHTFDLELERAILANTNIDLVDGRQSFDPGGANGVLLGTAAKLDAAAFDSMPKLRGVMRYGIGYDNIDVEAARQRGVPVGIVRDYCVDEVAEHALTGALALLRSVVHWDRNVRAGNWRSGERPRHRRIANLSFGIMGYGLIGRAAAQKAAALFGEVVVYDPLLDPQSAGDEIVVEADFNAFLSRVDALTLHVPLTDATRGIIDAAALARMRPDAVLVNASRGGLIVEADLDAALKSGTIAGAALDAFETEPVSRDFPLLDNDRILFSPHVAWLSEEAERDLRTSAARDLVRILDGHSPTTPVA